jgi:adenylylsulfate kinase
MSAMLADAGLIVVVALISPYQADRDRARRRVGAARWVEVFLDTPLAVCEQRDPMGLYVKARSGQIDQFTGVSAPYERPAGPHITLDTSARTVGACVEIIHEHLCERGFILPAGQAPRAAAAAPAGA